MGRAMQSSDLTSSGRWVFGRLGSSSLSPRSRLLFWAANLLTVIVWFWAFPFRSPVQFLDALFDLICLVGALVALIYVQRIRFAPIEIGWRVFIWGLLVRLLDVLTNQSSIPDGASSLLADGPKSFGAF